MRTYDRAEERRLLNQAWDRDILKLHWRDYDLGFKSEDLRPFWEPDEDNWQHYDIYDIYDINDIYRGKLFWLLMKLKLRSPEDVIWQLDW